MRTLLVFVLSILIGGGLDLMPRPAGAAPGVLQGELPAAGGAAPVVWGGGDTDALAAAAAQQGCDLRSAWIFVGGRPIGFLVGAPAFVNTTFLATFPAGDIPAGTIAVLRCEPITADEPAPALPPPSSAATVGAVPATLQLDAFYAKHVDAGGIAVVGSSAVPDAALLSAREIVLGILQDRPDIAAAIAGRGIRVGVIGAAENTTALPEYSDLDSAYWDARSRGLGATTQRPVTSAGEENLLCYAVDRYRGESILIHEFAHTILQLGIADLAGGAAFVARVESAYTAAMAAGLWSNTYAATNSDEYWAESVQSWFGANLESVPTDGVHNEIDTRAELRQYDPAIAALIEEALPSGWTPSCP